jgi:very-short-patch-repair endonuclease
VVELARRQYGVVARTQLLAAGVSSSTIGRMLAAGWLTRVHAGVYLVAGHPLSQPARWMAGVLAGGPEAILSHASAGALWEIVERVPGPVHVTAPSGRHKRRGLVLHRIPVPDGHRTTHKRIPVTTPSRTLLDLAAILSPRRLERAVETADRLGLLYLPELDRLCISSRGRKGAGRLRSLLDQFRPLPETRSALERRFLAFCRDAGLPEPAVNVPVAGLEVDFWWPEASLVVELDGYAFHRGRASFEGDRKRDALLQLAGQRVVRITQRRLADDAASVLAELQQLLGIRRTPTGARPFTPWQHRAR